MLPLSLLIFPLWWFSCAPISHPVEGGKYRDSQGYFEFLLPPGEWAMVSWEEVNCALWDPQDGATMVVNVTPLQEDMDLFILARHLLIAFERKKIISQDTIEVQGRETVKTVLEGVAEGIAVTAEVYVVKGEGMLYDLIFWAPSEVFSRKREVFHHVLNTISFLQPRRPQ